MDLIVIALRIGTVLLIAFMFNILNIGKIMDASRANRYFKYYFLGSLIIPAIITCFNFGTGLAISFIFSFAIQLVADSFTKKA